jgi:hypothetical protein
MVVHAESTPEACSTAHASPPLLLLCLYQYCTNRAGICSNEARCQPPLLGCEDALPFSRNLCYEYLKSLITGL